MIPMVDLKRAYRARKGDIDRAIQEVLESSHFVLGPNVRALEEEVADYLGARHALGCASGTDALHLALLALGIGAGDEVITSPFTFIATAEAICYLGARPVFVDIDPHTFNIDAGQVEAAITKHTRALLPVHLFGEPADMNALNAIASQHELLVVEDCAQSFGARIGNRFTGTLSAAGCFSFYPSKNLGCFGDGGLIATNSDTTAQRIASLRNHGSDKRYHHSVIGYNSRLDEIQAAILRQKLKHIDTANEQRRAIAQRYDELLSELPLITPRRAKNSSHVFHQYTVLTDQRERIMKHLQANEIACAIYYPIPLHQQQVFAGDSSGPSLPISEDVSQRCLSLPMYPEMTQTEISSVADAIRDALD